MKHLIFICMALILGAMAVMAEDPATQAAPAAPAAAPAPAVQMRGGPAVADFPAVKAATLMVKAADYVPEGGYPAGSAGIDMAYGKMMENGFGKFGKWLGEAKVQPTGAPFAIYYENPQETEAAKLTAKLAFPVGGDVTGTDEIKIEDVPAMPMAVSLTYEGPYEGGMPAWDAVMKYIPEHGFEMAGPPAEVFHKGPGQAQNPQEFVTEIRWPVKKAEAKPAAEGEQK